MTSSWWCWLCRIWVLVAPRTGSYCPACVFTSIVVRKIECSERRWQLVSGLPFMWTKFYYLCHLSVEKMIERPYIFLLCFVKLRVRGIGLRWITGLHCHTYTGGIGQCCRRIQFGRIGRYSGSNRLETLRQHPLKTLQWRLNEPDGVSNHQRSDCLLNHSFESIKALH